MYWVQKRLEERNELRQRAKKLASDTEPVWDSLCQAIKDSISDFTASDSYGRFEQNGKNHHVYWVSYVEDTPKPNTEKGRATITLDAESHTIQAKYRGVKSAPRSVTLDIEADSICIRSELGNLQSAEAAGYLLDPLLFPDLAGKIPFPIESAYEHRGITVVP